MKILLIDDHSLFRDGLHLVLQRLDRDIQSLDASSFEEALPFFSEHPDLDLILLDLNLPGLGDVEALAAIRATLPSTPVVVLSANSDGSKVQEILNAGAQGYIPKSTSADVLIRALKLVLSGGIYIPPEILTQQQAQPVVPGVKEESELTPRQNEVLKKLVHGYSNKEIGKFLNMAESTVRVHIAAILKALKVNNRTQAMRVALQKGLVTVEEDG